MCSTLWSVNVREGQREMVGDLADRFYRYNTFLIKKVMGSIPSKTLEKTIMLSPSFPWHADPVNRPVFHRRTRLQLAAKLACSVLHFHGSWLQARWSSRDISIPEGPLGHEQPFVIWSILYRQEKPACQSSSVSVVGNETLFPLGLALTELSLCRTIAALQTPEDENPDEQVTALKTARRYLDHVYSESGTRYGDVVQQCLFWSHTGNTTMDNEDFQIAVYHHIVRPLLDDVRNFDG